MFQKTEELKQVAPKNRKEYISIDQFIELSNLENSITEEDIMGISRKENIAIAREMLWYCMNKKGVGTRRIARFAGRKRETVRSGIRTIKNLIETESLLIEPYRPAIEYFCYQHKNE
jgi:chromosomal replication initiation ATPase DnaA